MVAGSLWNRRRFLATIPAALLALGGLRRTAHAAALLPAQPHPDPRPGITAAKVLAPGQLEHRTAAPVFDLVREIPQVMDGIRCYCGCGDLPENYSLLSCYEGRGMAQHCVVCQGEARLAHRLHQDGWSLTGIRASVDAEFGTD
jgi:hypothetical protein